MDGTDIFKSGEHFQGFVVERLLGKGGLGAVYLVRHAMLDTLYALKVLYPGTGAKEGEYVRRFMREARLATRIRHPNLVAVHDCGYDETRDLYFLVMDFVAGGTLRSAIGIAGRFEPARAAKVVYQVASALAAAQAFHVVHRDIKPENIMLQPDGSVKLVDLGIAKADNLNESLKTASTEVFGTPVYVSPEQAVNAADVDERADIYSLGIVFFEMVAGRCPYEGEGAPAILRQVLSDDPTPDIRDFNPATPPEVAVLVRRMCMKDRERRIGSLAELLRALETLDYGLGAAPAPAAEYVPATDPDAPTPVVDLAKLPENNPTLSFDTDDAEISAFVSQLKRKRRRRKLTAAAAVALTLLAVAAILLVAWYRFET